MYSKNAGSVLNERTNISKYKKALHTEKDLGSSIPYSKCVR